MATNITKAELEAQNEFLKQQIEELKAMIMANSSTPTTVTTAPSLNSDVAVVYMSPCLGHAKGNSFELNFNHAGDEFVLSRSAFDELVGKYYRWFSQGILAVSHKNADIAAAKGLKTDKEYVISAAILDKIGSMSPEKIEDLWNRSSEQEKQCIVYHFKRKFIENTSAGYRDRARVDCLNRLTNGGFDREATEVGTGSKKIQPKDLIIY